MAKAPKKMGRPSKRTPELDAEIVERLSQGEPLAVICRDPHMPHPTTVRDWAAADAELSLAIARAREDGFDRIAADCLAIADDTSNDTKVSEEGRETCNSEWVTRSKLRVETRLRLLAKWDPKRFGDKQVNEHTGPDGQPLQLGAPVVVFQLPDNGRDV